MTPIKNAKMIKKTPDELREEFNEHRKWVRDNKTGKRGDFSNYDLRGVNLSYAILDDVVFEGADLSGANFVSASLNRAELMGAKLVNTQFSMANARHANFVQTDATSATFSYADLSGTNFKDANLDGACFESSTLRVVYFAWASIETATFSRADLRGAFLQNATLNWSSRELITEILHAAAKTPAQFELVGLAQHKWCWNDYLEYAHPETEWALQLLRTYIKPKHKYPEALDAKLQKCYPDRAHWGPSGPCACCRFPQYEYTTVEKGHWRRLAPGELVKTGDRVMTKDRGWVPVRTQKPYEHASHHQPVSRWVAY